MGSNTDYLVHNYEGSLYVYKEPHSCCFEPKLVVSKNSLIQLSATFFLREKDISMLF